MARKRLVAWNRNFGRTRSLCGKVTKLISENIFRGILGHPNISLAGYLKIGFWLLPRARKQRHLTQQLDLDYFQGHCISDPRTVPIQILELTLNGSLIEEWQLGRCRTVTKLCCGLSYRNVMPSPFLFPSILYFDGRRN